MSYHLAVIGSGVVGAAIAYELSALPQIKVTLIDQYQPAMGATKAALGVLMGVISQKSQGRTWQLRHQTLQRYQSLIPELETLLQRTIPGNRQGILRLITAEKHLNKYQRLVPLRQAQGWLLEIWSGDRLHNYCPDLKIPSDLLAAVYSPQDQQIDPVALTQALVEGAQRRGVNCLFNNLVQTFEVSNADLNSVESCNTTQAKLRVDGVIIAAGLGSVALTQHLAQPVAMQPVLGQTMRLRLPQSLIGRDLRPVISYQDLTIVPLNKIDYWLGATVEFPSEHGELMAQPERLQQLHQQAIALFPVLAQATVLETWSGFRPRPQGQPAPVIGPLQDYDNVFLATGHYRNGVLLAPATALETCQWVKQRYF